MSGIRIFIATACLLSATNALAATLGIETGINYQFRDGSTGSELNKSGSNSYFQSGGIPDPTWQANFSDSSCWTNGGLQNNCDDVSAADKAYLYVEENTLQPGYYSDATLHTRIGATTGENQEKYDATVESWTWFAVENARIDYTFTLNVDTLQNNCGVDYTEYMIGGVQSNLFSPDNTQYLSHNAFCGDGVITISGSRVVTDWEYFEYGLGVNSLAMSPDNLPGYPAFTGVTSAEAQLTFTAVPVPAAVWLFGSGLGLLGWLRRQ